MRGSYQSRTTDEQVARILKLKKQSLSTAVISRRLGIPLWTINYVIRKEREKKNRLSLDPDAKTKPLPLDTTFYEILQLVTAKAKNYPILTKRQLEKLGGNIIG